jgi:hypothetical protein
MKKFALTLLAALVCAGAQAAQPNDDSRDFLLVANNGHPMYLSVKSIKEHPYNPDVIIYQRITNLNSQDPDMKDTSMVAIDHLHCRDRLVLFVADGMLQIYQQPFGRGKLLQHIPMASERIELKDTNSPLSRAANFACTHSGRAYGDTPAR